MMVEPIANVGPQEEALLEQLGQTGEPVILVINKIDTVEKETLLAVIARYAREMEFAAVVPLSAKTGEGVEALLEECTSSPRRVPSVPC